MTVPPLEASIGDPNLSPAIDPLRRTSPWVKLIAVLNFIMVILMLCMAIVPLFFAGAFTGNETGTALPIRALGALYIIVALLYLLPAVLAWRYARAITRFTVVSSAAQLVVALEAQRRVWKFWGILLLIGLTFGIIGTIGAIIAGGMMGVARGFP